MVGELASVVITLTNLTLNNNFRAFSFDMLEKLSSCHVLKLLSIADITSEFRAVELSMFL